MKHLTVADREKDFRIHALVFGLMTAAWGIGLASHWWFALGPGATKTDKLPKS